MRNEDQRIKTIFPHLRGRTVVYLGNSYELPDSLVESLSNRFSVIGYRFIVLPTLLKNLYPALSNQLFPGFERPNPGEIETQVKLQAGLTGKTGFLYKKRWFRYFRFRVVQSFLYLNEEVDTLINELRLDSRLHLRKKSKRAANKEAFGYFGVEHLPKALDYSEHIFDEVDKEELESPIKYKRAPGNAPGSNAQNVLSEIKRILKKYNLTLEELEILIGYTVKLSKMRITRNGSIIMTDFGNTEIKMDHLTKTVYFFYLKHPEGVRFKEVDNFRGELLHIYMGITGRDNPEEIRKSVIGHIDPYGSGLKVSASRIKKAFRDQLGEKVAKFYCLEGKKGEPYSIPIDRDYVIWEYPE